MKYSISDDGSTVFGDFEQYEEDWIELYGDYDQGENYWIDEREDDETEDEGDEE